MATNADPIEFYLSDPVEVIGRRLQEIARDLRASVEKVVSTSGALSAFDQHADIEVVFSGKVGPLSSQKWAVQVYVADLGDKREVLLAALGTGRLERAMHWGGRVGVLKMSASRARRDGIESSLRAH